MIAPGPPSPSSTTPALNLRGLRVAVDVQHLYRNDKPNDQGSVYTLADGTHTTEAACTTLYASRLVAQLRMWGADVLTNNPGAGLLVGDYWQRNRAATAWNAALYLACHMNAGRGSYACAEYMAGSALMCAVPAALILDALKTETGYVGRSRTLVRGDRGPVCIEAFTRGPAMILEPLFGDYAPAQAWLAPPRLARLGGAIAWGVARWYAGRLG